MSLVDLGKRLLDAAKQGDTEEVRQLMTNGAPFTTDWLGTSPLHMAAQYGHLDTAEVLLRAGISRDARTKVDRTPLHIASQEGHLKIVDLLIRHGADIEAKDMLKMTSLHWAVERGHQDVIACLLRNGAHANCASKFYKTPADIAMDNCRSDLVELIGDFAKNAPSKPLPSKSEPKQILFQLTSTNNLNNKLTPVMLKHTIPKNQVIPKKERRPIASNRNAAKPIILQANNQSTITITGIPKSEMTTSNERVLPISEDIRDNNSTSVLATLAALAEATAPNTNLTNSETLQWLETHGIAMLPSDTSTVVTSAIESGHSISLTEAGKLALNWGKENSASGGNSNKAQEKSVNTIKVTKAGNQRIYTIVQTADQNQFPTIISGSPSGQNAPIMVVSNSENDEKNELIQTITLNESSALTEDDDEEDNTTQSEDENEKLKQELAAIRKQAEEYKARLAQKEHEAQEYKKQLDEMKASPKSKS